VANVLDEEIPQIYATCGRGPRSALRILRPGLAVAELAVWQLPGQPTAVWTLRRTQQDELDALIVVSFANATLVRMYCSHSTLKPQYIEGAAAAAGNPAASRCKHGMKQLVWVQTDTVNRLALAHVCNMWRARLQVLAIGETVEEVNDSGFLGSTPTLRTQLMADDSMLQVRLTPAACRAPCTTKAA
jgi:Mono-functional DNA-alkylating methyl methanesulfonate N-term